MSASPESDLRRLLGVVHELQAPRTLEEFPHVIIHLLPQLVSAQSTAYNEVDVRRGRVVAFIDPPTPSAAELAARLEPFLSEHPLIAHIRATGDGAAVKISDFLSAHDFHRTALYNEFFWPLGIRDQMSLCLASSEGAIIGVTLNRERRDFSERERRLLELLRPHLQRAHDNAQSFSQLHAIVAAQGGLWENMAQGVILLRPDGSVAFRSAQSAQWLRDYFSDSSDGGALPAALRGWLAAHKAEWRVGEDLRAATPFVIARGAQRLSVRHFTETLGHDVLLLDEEILLSPLEALRALGLTQRQAEVLFWMAHGQSNAQIAARLHTSPHTIKNHSAAIFERLQVSNRHAAIVLALAKMGLQPSARFSS